jgi:hypothetical protein
MVCAISHGGHRCGDRLLVGLAPRGGDDGLIKAVGEVPEPVLTKPAGFVDPLLEDMVGYIVLVYEGWLAKLPRRAFATKDIDGVIERGHRVLARRIVSPAVGQAWNIGRLGSYREDQEVFKAVRGAGLQLDLLIPPEPKKLKLELKKVDAEVAELEKEYPLKPWDRYALEYAKRRAAAYVRGLGNRLSTSLETLAIETEREVRRDLMERIRREVSDARVRRDTARQLASAIGRETGDWSRNLDRIARTELQETHQHGWAAHFRATTGADTLVAKRVDDNACPDCKRLYLEPDGTPKIFVLSELEANGTNVGLPRSQWVATVGTIHPYCTCVLVRVPKGFGFNEAGQMVPEGGLT